MNKRRSFHYRFEHPYPDDAVIGDIDLAINQRFLYLFDFGDEWHFYVTLEKIQTDKPLVPSPKILERKGKAPAQYGRYYE